MKFSGQPLRNFWVDKIYFNNKFEVDSILCHNSEAAFGTDKKEVGKEVKINEKENEKIDLTTDNIDIDELGHLVVRGDISKIQSDTFRLMISADKIRELVKNQVNGKLSFGDIEFVLGSKIDGSGKIKEVITINRKEYSNIKVDMHPRFKHPFRLKYETDKNKLVLSKIVYRDCKLASYAVSFYGYIITTLEYNLVDTSNNNKVLQTIQLNNREVLEQLAFSTNDQDYVTEENQLPASKHVYIIGSKAGTYIGLDIAMCLVKKNELNEAMSEVEFVEDKEGDYKLDSWISKMAMINVNVQTKTTSKSMLTKIETNDTELKTIKIPDFVYVSEFAFRETGLQEVIFTGNCTILATNDFMNKFNQRIRIRTMNSCGIISDRYNAYTSVNTAKYLLVLALTDRMEHQNKVAELITKLEL